MHRSFQSGFKTLIKITMVTSQHICVGVSRVNLSIYGVHRTGKALRPLTGEVDEIWMRVALSWHLGVLGQHTQVPWSTLSSKLIKALNWRVGKCEIALAVSCITTPASKVSIFIKVNLCSKMTHNTHQFPAYSLCYSLFIYLLRVAAHFIVIPTMKCIKQRGL